MTARTETSPGKSAHGGLVCGVVGGRRGGGQRVG